MKKISKVFAIALALIIMLQSSVVAMATTQTGSIFDTNTYTHQTKFDGYTISQGIDVSYHNDKINWESVKAGGVDFAILRVGYRGYASEGKVMPDVNFSTYIHDAYAQGMKLGIYFYSQALTPEEAAAEAAYSISTLQAAVADIPNFKLDMPIVYDYEFAGTDAGRLDSAWKDGDLNKTKMTNNAISFCNTVKNAGYEAMVYASKSFLNTQLNKTTIANAGYRVWLAHYTTNTDYTGDYDIWQFSSKGKISGISGNVDCNFMYYNSSAITFDKIPDQPYNGAAVTPEIVAKYAGVQLVKDVDYTVEYANNVNIGTANAIIHYIGNFADYPMQTISFKIVPPAVTGVTLTARGTKSVDVSWTPVALAGISGYKVEVKKSTGWVEAGTTTGTSLTVTGLAVASNYLIRVRAYSVNALNPNEVYDGAYSAELQTATNPDKVTELKATAYTTTSLTVSWKKQTNASLYNVYIYDSATKQYVLNQSVKGTTTAKITGLTAGKTYKIVVEAVKNAKEGVVLVGQPSAELKTCTKPKAPSIKTPSTTGKRKLKAKWSAVASVTGYQVKWSQSSNFSGSKTVTVKGKSATSKTVTTAKSKKYYYVKVRAYKTVGGVKYYSAWSSAKKIKVK